MRCWIKKKPEIESSETLADKYLKEIKADSDFIANFRSCFIEVAEDRFSRLNLFSEDESAEFMIWVQHNYEEY